MKAGIRTWTGGIIAAALLAVSGSSFAMGGKPDPKPIDPELTVGPHINRVIIFGDSLSDDGGDNSTLFLLKTLNGQTGAKGVDHLQRFVNSYLKERVPGYDSFCNLSISNCTKIESKILSGVIKLTTLTGAVPVIPGDHYANGRWSNGKMWPEYLAPMMGISVQDSERYQNVSHAGAWSLCIGDKALGISDLTGSPATVAKSMVNGSLIPPCLKLIAKNWIYQRKQFNKTDMAVVFFGGNDYLNKFDDPARVVEAQKEIVELAAEKGAGNIAWLNMPDLKNTPRYITGSKQGDAAKTSQLITQHNELLFNEYQGLKESYKKRGIKLIHIDAKKIFDNMLANYQSLGFTVTDRPCSTILTPGLDDDEIANRNPTFRAVREMERPNGTICKNQNQYMFWDSVHPTTRTHEIIAKEACKILRAEGYKQCKL